MFWILALGLVAVLWNKQQGSQSATLTTAEAKALVHSDPGTQQQIQQQAQAAENQVAIDVNTSKTQRLKTGETIIGTAISGAVAAAAASSTGTLIFSAAVWPVVGAIIAGIFLLVNALRSETHLYANALVKNYENPFGAFIIQAQQTFQAGLDRGTLTGADAGAITNAVIIAWAKYTDAMNQFEAKGGDWQIVARQSMQNLDSGQGMNGTFYLNKSLPKAQLGNGFMTYWIRWFTQKTQELVGTGK